MEFDEQARLLRIPPGIRLDLGATAKAWAADRSAARIAADLGCGVLVSLGGDIAVSGEPPTGGWRIRVQDISGSPGDPPAGPSAVVAIRTGGMATSSTAARRWRRGGDVLHHILDSRTGLPAAPVWRTVSVSAASCTDANIASTAAIIRGRGTGLAHPSRPADPSRRRGWPRAHGRRLAPGRRPVRGDSQPPEGDRPPEAGQHPEDHWHREADQLAETGDTP